MLWIALAALISLPVPINARLPDIRAIFTADDVPAYLREGGASTRVVYPKMIIRPDGSLQSCVAEVSSGNPKLDTYTCALIVKRARWKPATWTDGTPVYGVIKVPVGWMVSDAPLSDEQMLKAETPDLELPVNQLPKGAHSIVEVSLEIAVDQNGRILSCDEWPPLKNDHRKQFPELVPVACQEVIARLTPIPPLDPSGQKVRSVQNVSVHFIMNR